MSRWCSNQLSYAPKLFEAVIVADLNIALMAPVMRSVQRRRAARTPETSRTKVNTFSSRRESLTSTVKVM